jgi:hypothetical protein
LVHIRRGNPYRDNARPDQLVAEIGHYVKLIGKCGSYLGITCRHVP